MKKFIVCTVSAFLILAAPPASQADETNDAHAVMAGIQNYYDLYHVVPEHVVQTLIVVNLGEPKNLNFNQAAVELAAQLRIFGDVPNMNFTDPKAIATLQNMVTVLQAHPTSWGGSVDKTNKKILELNKLILILQGTAAGQAKGDTLSQGIADRMNVGAQRTKTDHIDTPGYEADLHFKCKSPACTTSPTLYRGHLEVWRTHRIPGLFFDIQWEGGTHNFDQCCSKKPIVSDQDTPEEEPLD